MRNSLQYHIRQIIIAPILLCMVIVVSCSKPEEETAPVVIPVQPVSTAPTGVIQTFTINDTLVAFNTGTVVKWLVNGTNNLTVVNLDSVKVANYGSIETGPRKKNTVFTLEVNSGKKATVTLNVADTVTSLLWSKGKSARLIKKEVYIDSTPDPSKKWGWIDTSNTITAYQLDQRLFFGLTNSVTSIQGTSNTNVSQGNAGKFIVDIVYFSFIWQNVLYKIESIDATSLVVTYDGAQPIGPKLRTRNTYVIQ